jgi:D-3-phosphoglycerate dehydrogenase
MSKPTIVTCFPLNDAQVEQIRRVAGDDFRVIASAQEDIHQQIYEADIFCGHVKTEKPMDWQSVVDQGRLKWIQSSAAGLDHCLAPAVIDSPIVVSGCSALFANQVAETSLALLMGLIRRLPVFFQAQQNREYFRRPTDDLFGKKVGIIGFGGNGFRIATTLRPLVNDIIATDMFPDAEQHAVESGIVKEILPADHLEQVMETCDVTIVTLPLAEANEKRIGDVQFRLCKPGAYFINVGRGSVVDQDALIAYLSNGSLAGAGLDVADPEPIELSSPLWDMGNVIITPHIGAQSAWRVPKTVDFFCENLKRYSQGQPLVNAVDKQLGFPRPADRVPLDGSW